jgi:tRNA nucleotidyltransferase (CCA-adding enzyme)
VDTRELTRARERGEIARLPGLVPTPLGLLTILGQLESAGYDCLIAGGAVRDALLGIPPADFDVEVYGMTYEQVTEFLGRHGRVDLVGKSFGVVKFSDRVGNNWDFSVPRRDSKIGLGHRDFRSAFDPGITPREAASRRDFTINAMAYDPVREEIHDYFGGRADLAAHVLRATSAAFSEDPLRVLRGMQFACRFDLSVDAGTAAMCRSIADQYGTLPKERVCDEFMKWAIKASRPGRILEYLTETGWLAHFPLLGRIQNVPQDPEWHPEGDVGIHTMHVVNAAAKIAERERLSEGDRAVLLFSALTHDLGKADTTELREKDGRLRWTAHGHQKSGGPLARTFLESIWIKAEIVDRMVPLVENHLAHMAFSDSTIHARAIRRLAARLAPANITQLVWLIEADYSGRPPLPAGLPEEAARMRDFAENQQVEAAPQPALILGRHVMPYFGGKPGPHIGGVTKAAYEAQLDGAFSTEEEALQWLAEYMASREGGLSTSPHPSVP